MAYEKWEKQFQAQIELRVSQIGEIQRQAATDMLEEGIRPRTPYGMPETWKRPAPAGYTPGQARASWKMEVNPLQIRIYSNLDYIVPLETGWSRQAPTGMMRLSALEWPQWVKKAEAKLGNK